MRLSRKTSRKNRVNSQTELYDEAVVLLSGRIEARPTEDDCDKTKASVEDGAAKFSNDVERIEASIEVRAKSSEEEENVAFFECA